MRLVFTSEAEADIEAIGDQIAKDRPARALSFIHELRESCFGLLDLPERFSLVPRYEHMGIRRRVHGNYLIFYRVEVDAIAIIHVLHGAMNYEALLFPSA